MSIYAREYLIIDFSPVKTLAVMDFDTDEAILEETAENATEFAELALVEKKLFRVVERVQVKKILKEQAFQQKGCVEDYCKVKIGQMLAAQKILTGKLNRLGVNFVLFGHILDVQTGAVEFSDRAVFDRQSNLEDASKELVNKLALKYREHLNEEQNKRVHGKLFKEEY